MSDIDSENEYIWDLLGQQNFIQPDPKIASEGFSGNNIKTDAVTRIPTLKSNKNVKSNFITKKYSGSKPKLSPSDAKSQHTSTTRELSEEEMKGIKLTEELKDIKLKVERAKSNREQLKKIYEDRIKSDPHKDKRHLSFEDLRREYVGLLVERETQHQQIKLYFNQHRSLEANIDKLQSELLSRTYPESIWRCGMPYNMRTTTVNLK